MTFKTRFSLEKERNRLIRYIYIYITKKLEPIILNHHSYFTINESERSFLHFQFILVPKKIYIYLICRSEIFELYHVGLQKVVFPSFYDRKWHPAEGQNSSFKFPKGHKGGNACSDRPSWSAWSGMQIKTPVQFFLIHIEPNVYLLCRST